MQSVNNKPVIGMPCTLKIGTDAYTHTVVLISSGGKQASVQENSVRCTSPNGIRDGSSQTWDIQSNPRGRIRKVYMDKWGHWCVTSEDKCYRVTMGEALEYRDPNF